MAACVVLGLCLLAAAVAASWVGGGTTPAEAAEDRRAQTFELARALWHSTPVDQLFPRTLRDTSSGRGGAPRTWRRVGVAPDTDCREAKAFDAGLAKVLEPVGCERLLRATYTDATSTAVTTVGVLVADTDRQGMAALNRRWRQEGLGDRPSLMPRPVPFRGTVAAAFGPRQRASWTVDIRTDTPFVVYAVSGFADGRAISEPQPVDKAVKSGATSVPGEAGLGHEAKALGSMLSDRLVKAARAAWQRQHPDPEGR